PFVSSVRVSIRGEIEQPYGLKETLRLSSAPFPEASLFDCGHPAAAFPSSHTGAAATGSHRALRLRACISLERKPRLRIRHPHMRLMPRTSEPSLTASFRC